MTQTSSSKSDRFVRVFDQHVGEREPWDHVLWEDPNYVVAPSLGSVVPRWLLLIPKAPSLNFATTSKKNAHIPIDVLNRVTSTLSPSADFIWFEHGAGEIGSNVGCGVDYAHIHLLLSPDFVLDEFRDVVSLFSDGDWKSISPTAVYDHASQSKNYYVFGNKRQAYYREGDSLGPQFFRKVVARLIGRPERWDYNQFPERHQVLKTLTELALTNLKVA